MTTKKGYVENKVSTGNPNTVDYVWIECIKGDQYINGHRDKWNALPADKRGIVHKVYLDAEPKAGDRNGSKLHELISDLQLSSVNLGAPLIVDIFDFKGGAQFALADINYYFKYLVDHNINFSKKPLIRIQIGNWETWYRDHQPEAEKLLTYADVLLVQWSNVPDTLTKIGKPKWQEYANGLIRYDSTAQWLVDPVIPPVDPDPDPEPEPDQEPTDIVINLPGEYEVDLTMTVFGIPFKITGKVKAVENE
jgi:hypothetical protein